MQFIEFHKLGSGMKTHLLRTAVTLGMFLATFVCADAKWIIYEGKSVARFYPYEGNVRRIDRWMALDFNTETGKVTAHAFFDREIVPDVGIFYGAGSAGELFVSRPVAAEEPGPELTLLTLSNPKAHSAGFHFHLTLKGRNVEHFPDQEISNFPTRFSGSELNATPESFLSSELWLSYSSKLSNTANNAGMDLEGVIAFLSAEMEKPPKKNRKK